MNDDENMLVSGQNTAAGTDYQHYYHLLWSEFIIELTLTEWLTNSIRESYLELWGVYDVVVKAFYMKECYLSRICLKATGPRFHPTHMANIHCFLNSTTSFSVCWVFKFA